MGVLPAQLLLPGDGADCVLFSHRPWLVLNLQHQVEYSRVLPGFVNLFGTNLFPYGFVTCPETGSAVRAVTDLASFGGCAPPAVVILCVSPIRAAPTF